MAIIVNGSALRTLGQPIYVDGKQVLEGYFDGVKCYPDEYPHKYVRTIKKTHTLPATHYYDDYYLPNTISLPNTSNLTNFYFDGESTDLTFELSIEETTESNLGLGVGLTGGVDPLPQGYYQLERTFIYPKVANGEDVDAWHLKTTTKISSTCHGSGVMNGRCDRRRYNPNAGYIIEDSGPLTAHFYPEDIQRALNFTHVFEFYQSFTLRDSTGHPNKTYSEVGPHGMSYGPYNTSKSADISSWSHYGYETITRPDHPDLEEISGGHTVRIEGSNDRPLKYRIEGSLRVDVDYHAGIPAFRHRERFDFYNPDSNYEDWRLTYLREDGTWILS